MYEIIKLKEDIDNYECLDCCNVESYPQEWILEITSQQKEVFSKYASRDTSKAKVTEIKARFAKRFKDDGLVKMISFEDEKLTKSEAESKFAELSAGIEDEISNFINDSKPLDKEYFLSEISKFIEHHRRLFNIENGVYFDSVANMNTASNQEGYSLRVEAKAFINWVYVGVWDKMRVWEKTLTAIPTEQEFRAELSKYER